MIKRSQNERYQEKLKSRGKEMIECLICGKSFIQVGSHVQQIHKISARKYRERFELEVKRGTVPQWYREIKGKLALENKTYKNLEIGAKFRFKKGDTVPKYKRSKITIEKIKENCSHTAAHKKHQSKLKK